MRYYVFLDSNSIIGSHYRIDISPTISQFFDNSGNKLILSEVVVDEVIRKYKEQQEDIIEDAKKLMKLANKFGVSFSDSIKDSLDFEADFKKKIVDLSIKVLPVETASLRQIYQIVMARLKPFKYKDQKESGGIKDAIIWFSYLEYIRDFDRSNFEETTYIFITNDSDFLEEMNKPVLHSQLASSINEIIRPDKNFKILNHLNELIKQVIIPTLPTINIPKSQNGSFIEKTLKANSLIIKRYITQVITEYVGEDSGVEIESMVRMKETHIDNEAKFLNDSGYFYFVVNYKVVFIYIADGYNPKIDKNAKLHLVEEISDELFVVRETTAAKIIIEVIFNPTTYAIEKTNVMEGITLYYI